MIETPAEEMASLSATEASGLEDRVIQLTDRVMTLENTTQEILGLIRKADETISKIAVQVMPTIEDLMKSPLLKMLWVKK